jgi:integrase
MRLFKRGDVWYGQFYENGGRVQRSTKCTDKVAAESVARLWERDAADPDAAKLRDATLSDALRLLLTDREERANAGRASHATVSFYAVKTGHLTRMFEHDERGNFVPFPLAKLKAYDVDRYISKRRAEGACENTIAKELIALRASLKLARRAGLWRGDPAAVCPIAFAPEYKPRRRFLTQDELRRLLAALPADRAAAVAFMVATSAEWGAIVRAERGDVDLDAWRVLVRGTKRTTRWRTVPLVTHAQRSLVEYAFAHARGVAPVLFLPWQNVRRDLAIACDKVGIEPCSPNDLRRTCATWLRQDGAPPDLIAPVMGHADTRMVERVYGRLPLHDLEQRLASTLKSAADRYNRRDDTGTKVSCSVFAAVEEPSAESCSAFASDSADSARKHGLSADRRTQKNPRKAGSAVPRDGIEPPTRGFSIPCSTD